MSLRDQAWWPEFCARLKVEPLDQLSRVYGQSSSALAVALNMADNGGPATDAAWWPEAVRMYKGGESLREVSRLFGVNLRRLRRGLARAGLRVAGEDVGADGPAALSAFRDRLGREPDSVIADEAGLTVEAVQGERRRLNIPPFRKAGVAADGADGEGGDLSPSADERPAPAVAPVVAAPVVAAPVIAAPAADPIADLPPMADDAAPPAPVAAPSAGRATSPTRRVVATTTAPPERPSRDLPPRPGSTRDAGGRDPSWDAGRPAARGVDWAESRRPPWERRARGDVPPEPVPPSPASAGSPRAWRRSDVVEPTVVRRPRPGGRIGALEGTRSPVRPADEALFDQDMSPEEREAARMAEESPRERRGRLRLVRPDALPPLTPEPEVEAVAKPKRRKDPTYSPVRVVKPDELSPEELSELVSAVRVDEPQTPEDAPRAAAPAADLGVAPAAMEEELDLSPPAVAEPAPTSAELPVAADDVVAPSARRSGRRGGRGAWSSLLEDRPGAPEPLVGHEDMSAPEAVAEAPVLVAGASRADAERADPAVVEAAPPAEVVVADLRIPPAPVAPALPAAPPPAVAAPAAAPPLSLAALGDLRAWIVRIDGRPQPLLILAANIQAAAERAAREVGAVNLAAASISVMERL